MTSFTSEEELRQAEERQPWLERPISPNLPLLSWEKLLITLILIFAFTSRFYLVGERVMSHDETNHVVPAFSLYQGLGYTHDPITHSPFKFFAMAFSYFILGDSDFSSRAPAALFSVATVFLAWFLFRRYLGRTGGLLAALLMLISPFMMFYGRYTRDEPFMMLAGLVMLYAILRYLEAGQDRTLYLLTLALALEFILIETAYIYTAEALIILGLIFLSRVLKRTWAIPSFRGSFLIALGAGIILVGGGLAANFSGGKPAGATPTVVAPAVPGTAQAAAPATGVHPLVLGLGGLAAIALLAALYFLIRGYGFKALRQERTFGLIVFLFSMVLPLLSPFPINLIGWNPLDYTSTGLLRTAVILTPMTILAVLLGVWWRPKLWLSCAALFYAIFVSFFTSFFTNGSGFFTGIVGGLGYWLTQQAVERGSQPWYYYIFLQIPMYEYLSGLGALLALILVLRHPRLAEVPAQPLEESAPLDPEPDPELPQPNGQEAASSDVLLEAEPATEITASEIEAAEPLTEERVPFVWFLLLWTVMSIAAFTVAGEKMPWITTNMALPMILVGGWAFGYLVDTTPWRRLWDYRGYVPLLLLPVFFASLVAALASLFGNTPPFQGKELAQLQATATFLLAAIGFLASGAGILWLTRRWSGFELGRAVAIVLVAFLAFQTARTAIRASFINYNNAKEFLVYAHMAPGPKEVLNDIIQISERTSGGLDIAVAYDNEALYPFWWYLRSFPNKVYFADNPTRELRNDPIILVGDANYGKIESIVANNYTYYQTTRIWWPMQDYYNLTWERIWGAISSPGERAALWQLWFNRDYTLYAKVNNISSLTLTTWQPSNSMRIYIRKDIVAQMWQYGVAPTTVQPQADPYEKGTIQLSADKVVGQPGNAAGQLSGPRGIAVAPDGSLYVADTGNNRIVHFAADGSFLKQWGSFADATKGNAPGGTFNQPWGVAVGPDGSVYVADTWNSRIEKFTADGQFTQMWGYFGQAEKPEAFWGPRGLAFNSKGQLLITDTGNKRVVIFDANGNFITQFGTSGSQPGQLDEPVGIGVDKADKAYVADTWNQRIQVFTPDSSGTGYTPSQQWEVTAWFGQSLDNKPYLAVDGQGNVFVTDPEGYRVLEFTGTGTFVRAWGDNGTGPGNFGLAAAIAVDPQGNVWVTDAGNSRAMHFTLPK